MFCKPDKGNGVVILHKSVYRNKIEAILSDQSKFKELDQDHTAKREASLQRFLRVLKSKGVFSDVIYDWIRPRGSNASRIYGLPKIHKPGFPLRPIVSAVGSYISWQYLIDILKPLANNSFTVKDSFSFTHELLSVTNIPFMCSFDVVGLFKNIPVDKGIDICLKKLYKDTDRVNNLTCEQLKRLLKYCVKENHFQFEDKYFDQIDGVAMGSPLGPILANILCQIWNNMFLTHMKVTYQHCIGDMWTTSF